MMGAMSPSWRQIMEAKVNYLILMPTVRNAIMIIIRHNYEILKILNSQTFELCYSEYRSNVV